MRNKIPIALIHPVSFARLFAAISVSCRTAVLLILLGNESIPNSSAEELWRKIWPIIPKAITAIGRRATRKLYASNEPKSSDQSLKNFSRKPDSERPDGSGLTISIFRRIGRHTEWHISCSLRSINQHLWRAVKYSHATSSKVTIFFSVKLLLAWLATTIKIYLQKEQNLERRQWLGWRWGAFFVRSTECSHAESLDRLWSDTHDGCASGGPKILSQGGGGGGVNSN